jgi:hypothetical protein
MEDLKCQAARVAIPGNPPVVGGHESQEGCGMFRREIDPEPAFLAGLEIEVRNFPAFDGHLDILRAQ